jgi:hypothetical protein
LVAEIVAGLIPHEPTLDRPDGIPDGVESWTDPNGVMWFRKSLTPKILIDPEATGGLLIDIKKAVACLDRPPE